MASANVLGSLGTSLYSGRAAPAKRWPGVPEATTGVAHAVASRRANRIPSLKLATMKNCVTAGRRQPSQGPVADLWSYTHDAVDKLSGQTEARETLARPREMSMQVPDESGVPIPAGCEARSDAHHNEKCVCSTVGPVCSATKRRTHAVAARTPSPVRYAHELPECEGRVPWGVLDA